MKNRTVTITVAARLDEVFSFLSQAENLPLWATGFCRRLRREDERWIVTTDSGDVFFAIDSIRSGGCIDMYSGVTLDEMSLMPVRLMKVDSGETAVIFSFFTIEQEGVSAAALERQFQGLVAEARGLVERFGGGTLSASGNGGLSVVELEPASAIA